MGYTNGFPFSQSYEFTKEYFFRLKEEMRDGAVATAIKRKKRIRRVFS